MSVATEITRLQKAKADIKTAIENKGVTVGDGLIDTYANKISAIPSAGGSHDEGYAEAEKTFWDMVQRKGTRGDHNYLFRNWYADGWRPIYDMKPTTASYMFYGFETTDKSGINIPKICEEQGITIDYSNSTAFTQFGAYSYISHLGTIDTRKATAIQNLCANMTKLIQVHLILKDDGSQTINGCFANCPELEDLSFDGVIGKTVVINCPLNKMSFYSTFASLSTTATSQTLTVSETAVNKAFETAEGANDGSTSAEWNALVASKPNWSIALG